MTIADVQKLVISLGDFVNAHQGRVADDLDTLAKGLSPFCAMTISDFVRVLCAAEGVSVPQAILEKARPKGLRASAAKPKLRGKNDTEWIAKSAAALQAAYERAPEA